MATIITVDWTGFGRTERRTRYAELTLQRWAERQGGAAFVSVNSTFIISDYAHYHREMELVRHILNVNGLSYRCIANVDLGILAEETWARAIIQKHNNNNKKGA